MTKETMVEKANQLADLMQSGKNNPSVQENLEFLMFKSVYHENPISPETPLLCCGLGCALVGAAYSAEAAHKRFMQGSSHYLTYASETLDIPYETAVHISSEHASGLKTVDEIIQALRTQPEYYFAE